MTQEQEQQFWRETYARVYPECVRFTLAIEPHIANPAEHAADMAHDFTLYALRHYEKRFE